MVALRKESVDRNLISLSVSTMMSWSLSARRAWIEIMQPGLHLQKISVALRKESVDRNARHNARMSRIVVALRKESVDRNKVQLRGSLRKVVALRKESVDRNKTANRLCKNRSWSLSARRAWIEIWLGVWIVPAPTWSLSARRAWIEIGSSRGGGGGSLSRSPQGERG